MSTVAKNIRASALKVGAASHLGAREGTNTRPMCVGQRVGTLAMYTYGLPVICILDSILALLLYIWAVCGVYIWAACELGD